MVECTQLHTQLSIHYKDFCNKLIEVDIRPVSDNRFDLTLACPIQEHL